MCSIELFLLLILRKIISVYGTCGDNSTGWSGNLSYPDSPRNYPPNVDCTWYVTAPENAVELLIEFNRFDINDYRSHQYELGRTHCDDYLQISDENNNIVINRCGQYDVFQRLVTGNKMKIVFHSDSVNTGNGFSFTWKVYRNTTTTRAIPTTVTTNKASQQNTIMPKPTTHTTTDKKTSQSPAKTTEEEKNTSKSTTHIGTEITTSHSTTQTTEKMKTTSQSTTQKTEKVKTTSQSTTQTTAKRTAKSTLQKTTESTISTMSFTTETRSTATTPAAQEGTDKVQLIVLVVCGFLLLEVFVVVTSCVIWRAQKNRRNQTQEATISKDGMLPDQAKCTWMNDQRYSKILCNNHWDARVKSTGHVYDEIPLEDMQHYEERENPYCDIGNEYDVLRNPRKNTFKHSEGKIYGNVVITEIKKRFEK